MTDDLRPTALAEFTWVRWRLANQATKTGMRTHTLWHARAAYERYPGIPLTACKRVEIEAEAQVADGVPGERLCEACVYRVLARAFPTMPGRHLLQRKARAA